MSRVDGANNLGVASHEAMDLLVLFGRDSYLVTEHVILVASFISTPFYILEMNGRLGTSVVINWCTCFFCFP